MINKLFVLDNQPRETGRLESELKLVMKLVGPCPPEVHLKHAEVPV